MCHTSLYRSCQTKREMGHRAQPTHYVFDGECSSVAFIGMKTILDAFLLKIDRSGNGCDDEDHVEHQAAIVLL